MRFERGTQDIPEDLGDIGALTELEAAQEMGSPRAVGQHDRFRPTGFTDVKLAVKPDHPSWAVVEAAVEAARLREMQASSDFGEAAAA
jgi:hypothetical protein